LYDYFFYKILGDYKRAEALFSSYGKETKPEINILLAQIDLAVPIDLAITFDEGD
jgi:hypothetical protein